MTDGMNDKELIKEIVNSVAQLQDMKQWERLEDYFVKKPYIDNKALSGEMPAVIPKKRLIDGWRREIGSYFYATRHFIKRLAVRMVSSRRAKVSTGSWKISQMIFRLQDQAVRPIGATA
jgi:hypothetical protein